MPGWICEYKISVTHDAEKSREIHQWLNEQFGHTNYAVSAGRWRYFCKELSNHPHWKDRTVVVRFRDRADAMLFKLAWL